MKEPCQKCGKKLGFLEKSHRIDNGKLNVKFNSLCGSCQVTLKKGISKIEEMHQWMRDHLSENKDVQKNGLEYVEIDFLILLAVEALFSIEPNYYLVESDLNQTFIGGDAKKQVDKQKDIVRIVYKLLDYGFKENLKKNKLEQIRSFIAYMIQNEVYLEEIEVNAGIDQELVKANVFINRRGMIVDVIASPKLILISIPGDMMVDYEVATSEIINEMTFKNLEYPWQPKGKWS